MKRIFSLLSGLFLLLALSGCGGDGDGGGGGDGAGGGDQTPGTGVTLNAVLSGNQEVPAVTTAAEGSAQLVIASDNSAIDFSLSVSGFTDTITAAHIHQGALGENGSVIFTLVTSDFTGTATGTLSDVDAGVSMTFADAIALIQSGGTYINVHTTANPAGEIRGQLGEQTLNAVLGGGQETTPVSTPATGGFSLVVNAQQTSADFTLTVSGFTEAITAAHIHNGALGTSGPVVVTLATSDIAGSASGTFTATDDGVTMPLSELIDLIYSGNAYVNVHTATNPAGEIRGQLGPQSFTVALEGGQEVPAVTTAMTGEATVSIGALQNAIDFSLTASGNVSPITASHIHNGAAGANGSVVVTLLSSDVNSASGTLTATDDGVTLTLDDLINLILSGNAYINVHTTDVPSGEIRGQLGP